MVYSQDGIMAAMPRVTILQLIIIAGLISLIWSGLRLISGQVNKVSPNPSPSPVSLQPSPALTPSPSPSASPNTTPTPIRVSSPPSVTRLPAPRLEINQLRYPNSTQISTTGSSLDLESSDNVDTITNWYEDKIRSLFGNAKSFVKTKTNGKVLNKLVASGNLGEITVEISQDAHLSRVRISVNTKQS